MRGAYAISMILYLLSPASTALAADEVSSGDKLRMLYSNQFTFTDDGVPLVTIEIMSGQEQVTLIGQGGMRVLPNGVGNAELSYGSQWTVSVEHGKPAVLRDWAIVERHHPDHERAIELAQKKWTQRALPPRVFDIGTLFGVSGEVIDTRRVLIAVRPAPPAKSAQIRQTLESRYRVSVERHSELIHLPRGTIVGQSNGATLKNPSVLWFAPKNRHGTITVKNVVVGGGGSQLRSYREDRHYFGRIFVTVGKDGKLVVVNSIPTDRLLAGLVPAEIFPSAPPAALRAQAIAARTELLEKLGKRHFGDPFLLCSSQRCQVYPGAGKEHPRTTKAVRETRGLILRRAKGTLVDARYSASCGGYTEDKKHIWGGETDPSLIARVDAIPHSDAARRFAGGINRNNLAAFLMAPANQFYEGLSRYAQGRFRWKKTVQAHELNQQIAARYPRVGALVNIQPLERGSSGRINKLRLVGRRGTVIVRGDLRIRRLLGGLRSSLFVVTRLGPAAQPTRFLFRGAGFGHGVGMCQIGAIGMALRNKNHSQILRHYYKGSRIGQLY